MKSFHLQENKQFIAFVANDEVQAFKRNLELTKPLSTSVSLTASGFSVFLPPSSREICFTRHLLVFSGGRCMHNHIVKVRDSPVSVRVYGKLDDIFLDLMLQ